MKKFSFTTLCIALGVISFGLNAQVLDLDEENSSYINACAYTPGSDVLFLFSGSSVMLYDIANSESAQVEWFTLDGMSNINAAVSWNQDEILLFEGSTYRVFQISTASFLSDFQEWSGIPDEWENRIDAAVRWSYEEIMFFHDDEFLVYNFEEERYTVLDKYVEWEGWSFDFTAPLEAVFNKDGMIYFFNDGQAVMYDIETGEFFEPTTIGN